MRVILLCAGYGTSLYPLTEQQPKSLIPLNGEALLTHFVRKLEPLPSLEQIVIVSNGRFYDHFCKWRETLKLHIPLVILNDGTMDSDRRLGAIRDLSFALEKTGSNQDTLVLAGDNFFDADLNSFVSFARGKNPAPSVGVYDVRDIVLARKYGLIKTDSSFKITAFFEKPKAPRTTLASMGIYYFPSVSLSHIDRYLETNQTSDAPGYYVAWLADQTEVFAFQFQGAWFDIGDMDSYREADQYVHVHRQK